MNRATKQMTTEALMAALVGEEPVNAKEPKPIPKGTLLGWVPVFLRKGNYFFFASQEMCYPTREAALAIADVEEGSLFDLIYAQPVDAIKLTEGMLLCHIQVGTTLGHAACLVAGPLLEDAIARAEEQDGSLHRYQPPTPAVSACLP